MIELKFNDLLIIEDKEDKCTWFSLVAGVNDWGDKNFCRYILRGAPGFNEDFMDSDHSSEIIVVWRYDKTIDGFVKIYDRDKPCKTIEPAELTNKPVLYCGRTNKKTRAIIDAICKNYKEVKVTNLEDEKKLKAFEIIKKYPRCSLQTYLSFNKFIEKRWAYLTQEYLSIYGLPCSLEEYKIVIEALKE